MANEEIIVPCKYCGNELRAFASDVNRIVRCKSCGRFNRIEGIVQQRMQWQCPMCQCDWNIPVKMRGKVYKCWSCDVETQLLGPAALNIEEISFVDQIEQGGEGYEIIITLSNPGTAAQITNIQFVFAIAEEDVSAYYKLTQDNNNPTHVEYDAPIRLRCFVDVSIEAPPEATTIYVAVSGKDVLDEMNVQANATVEWSVIQQRVFAIQTEHEYQETAGQPFALQLWACLASGEIDPGYHGLHMIEFQLASKEVEPPPVIPPHLTMEFENGVGVTPREFVFYDASQQPQIIAFDNVMGGPKGPSEYLTILPAPANSFDFVVASPQINGCIFQGENEIRGIDAYGNIVRDFAQEVEITPAGGGEIAIAGGQNIVPAHAFMDGVADLTILRTIYNNEQAERFPITESFIACHADIQGYSQPIVIEENPIQLRILEAQVPRLAEQGQDFCFELRLKNLSQSALEVSPRDIHFQICHNEAAANNSYVIEPQQIALIPAPTGEEITLGFNVSVAKDLPPGITILEYVIIAVDPESMLQGKVSGTTQWQLEPSGRRFQIIAPDPLEIEAGKSFAIKVATYLGEQIDENYCGKRILEFEAQASSSPKQKEPQIPARLEVEFSAGVGTTSASLVFTHADEQPKLTVIDPGPGGARSEAASFVVKASSLDYFLVSLQEQVGNKEPFGDLNQIMAMDACGNLITDFAEPCIIYPASQKGQIYIEGTPNNTIPGEIFSDGIADLSDLNICYHSDLQSKLPREEEFCVACGKHKGKSAAVKILPRAAEIKILRCSAPEEIERGAEDCLIYLELENVGDQPAQISSALFSFSQQVDVSTHYKVKPNVNNSNLLIPGVPLQVSYLVEVGVKAPTGITHGEVKVTGIDEESGIPLQAKTNFQWRMEVKGRNFRVQSEHQNKEIAGNFFALKLSSFLENQAQDTSLNGERILEFQSNAGASPNGKEPEIPQSLAVTFSRGDAVTPAKFMLVDSKTTPYIQVKDTGSNAQGRTSLIFVEPGSLENFEVVMASELRSSEPLAGNNLIVARDGFGNVKKDFSEQVDVAWENIAAWLSDENGEKFTSLPGKWFHEGKLDLSAHQLTLVAAPNQKLPASGHLVVSYGDRTSKSNVFNLLSRPLALSLDEIITPNNVVQGQKFAVTFKLTNQNPDPATLNHIDFRFYRGPKVYPDCQVEALATNPDQLTASTSLVYTVSLSAHIPAGQITCKVLIDVGDAASQTSIELEGSFLIEVEPCGRTFAVESENNQKENAGIPFGLRLTTLLEEERDESYDGERTLLFSTNAIASPSARAPRLPKVLTINFHQGQAVTSREFILFNNAENPTIEVKDKLAGGPIGQTQPIEIGPGELQGFQFTLHNPQTNAEPFQGENQLRAVDVFGNVKSNFKDDVRIRSESHKGNIKLTGTNLLNIVPGNSFDKGIVDLSTAGMIFQADQSQALPISERFVASYGEKEGRSPELTIQPRPAGMIIDEVSFAGSVYQGEDNLSLTFRLKNTGDSNLSISEIKFVFSCNDTEITSQFTATPIAQNPVSLLAGSTANWTFNIKIDNSAQVGMIHAQIIACGADAVSQGTIEAIGAASFELLEKLREFTITTEHDNSETVGCPFLIKLIAFRDGNQDFDYHGNHQIHFSSSAQPASGYRATIPESESIEFSEGSGRSSSSFVLTNSAEQPVIMAEEKDKARGSSKPITLHTGKLQSLKFIFDKKSEAGYTMQPLDQFSNIISQPYTFDSEICPGAILTGSSGAFYKVEEIVGHGAMGKVYKAKRLNDNLPVAIKTTLFSALSDIGRFILEGLMLIRFNHPNIVKGYDLRQICIKEGNKVQSKFFMAMEFLPGQSVKDLLDSSKSGVLSPEFATKIILHTGRALSYMWERQTLHRDIKPENIQITEDNRTKLIDLGIARAESGEVDIYLTQKDTIVGSYPYIPPERLKSTAIDFRADIYSLGATYYHLLTGMPPYLDTYQGGGGKDLLDYLIRIRTKKMPTPPHKLIEIPGTISQVIMTMLNIKANKRYATPEEMLQALETVYDEVKPNH